jgi:hypothetical protein
VFLFVISSLSLGLFDRHFIDLKEELKTSEPCVDLHFDFVVVQLKNLMKHVSVSSGNNWLSVKPGKSYMYPLISLKVLQLG